MCHNSPKALESFQLVIQGFNNMKFSELQENIKEINLYICLGREAMELLVLWKFGQAALQNLRLFYILWCCIADILPLQFLKFSASTDGKELRVQKENDLWGAKWTFT